MEDRPFSAGLLGNGQERWEKKEKANMERNTGSKDCSPHSKMKTQSFQCLDGTGILLVTPNLSVVGGMILNVLFTTGKIISF